MKKIWMLLLVAICCLPYLAQAQKAEITGKLVKKPWSKSGQSYCAQGSDYYVIVAADKSETVLAWDDSKPQLWQKYEGKQVKAKGEHKTKTIQHDPNGQHPVSMDGNDSTTCSVFHIYNISPATSKSSHTKTEKTPLIKGK